MSQTPLTRNITKVFRLATDSDRAAGYGWYGRARDLAERLAAQAPTSVGTLLDEDEVHKAAGVIAAISPRLAWRKNVEYAELAYHYFATNPFTDPTSDVAVAWFAGSIPTLNVNAKKAYRILLGDDPELVLGGPKVTAFYHTIVNPTDVRSVVVDRHAVDIAYGRTMDDDTRNKALSGKRYGIVAGLYVRAAEIISKELGEEWTPARVQATTWTYWRRERAAAYHGEA